MKNFNNVFKVVYFIISMFTILPLVFYLLNFGSFRLSDDIKEWESFSNYWAPFLSLSTAIFAGIIAYYSYLYNKKADAPLITFEMINIGTKQYYIIKNAGKIPAVNCFLYTQKSGSTNKWDERVNCYVIKPDELKVISWIPKLQKARMYFENFAGEKYSTTIKDQTNDFSFYNEDPGDLKTRSYTEKSDYKIEDEINKSIKSSSEHKEDMKMLTEIVIQKSKDCNDILLKKGTIEEINPHLIDQCINEIIISLQLLTSMSEAIGTQYIKEREKYFFEIFWIQLNVKIRSHIKECENKNITQNNDIQNKHLETIHSHFKHLYQSY